MPDNVIPFAPTLYRAKTFRTHTELGEFSTSGTLCGHICFSGPFEKIYCLSPDEVAGVIRVLQQSRDDVLAHSDPQSDPRLYDGGGCQPTDTQ